MLSQAIGSFDFSSAIVMIAICAMLFGITASLIYSRRPNDREYELKLRELEANRESIAYRNETERATTLKKMEQNLITSHREDQ